MFEPEITRNHVYVLSRGRYKIICGQFGEWTWTLCGARRAARRLKRKANSHGQVVT